MSEKEPMVFTGITPEHYGRLSAKAREAGIAMDGESGRATKFGVEIEWKYEAAEQRLTLACLSKPFFVSDEDLHKRMQSLVESTRA
ncbi:MAG: hypothetical protein WCE75_08705 [Terracidiphilus sp.]